MAGTWISSLLQNSCKSSGNFSFNDLPSFWAIKDAGKPQLYLIFFTCICCNRGFRSLLLGKVSWDRSVKIWRSAPSYFNASMPLSLPQIFALSSYSWNLTMTSRGRSAARFEGFLILGTCSIFRSSSSFLSSRGLNILFIIFFRYSPLSSGNAQILKFCQLLWFSWSFSLFIFSFYSFFLFFYNHISKLCRETHSLDFYVHLLSFLVSHHCGFLPNPYYLFNFFSFSKEKSNKAKSFRMLV